MATVGSKDRENRIVIEALDTGKTLKSFEVGTEIRNMGCEFR